MDRNIALIGFMGSGKTTLGRLLADELGIEFTDIDHVAENRLGMPIARSFELYGPDRFRKVERECIEDALRQHGVVLAVGGGAPGNALTRRMLRERCLVVLLCAPSEVLLRRTAGVTGRPLLDGLDEEARTTRVRELLCSRRDAYEQTAHVRVNTEGEIEEALERLLEAVMR